MAATTEQQMSLTVAPRGSSSHLNRPARQLVPAFLQKLYEMVNDPADQDLIRWSDTGDSFFVLDQERFASEVLGRWFKHKNFSSFVRQLNMYGFHKIPHLQQGVLRSDSDTEFWNFEHPHFLRGQPDLLCLIQRKKQAATAGDDGHGHHAAPPSGKDGGGTSAVGTLSANQLLDINSIVNGIQAIKRHQAAISADLNELKSSNQHLWQEAMAARERHKKHQDTINRILKFLAGVFGHGENVRKDDDASHAVVARKPQRLLIADGRSGKKTEINEMTEEEPRSSMESARSTASMNFFGSLDTPSAPPSEAFTSPRFTSIEPSVADGPTVTPMDATPQPESRPAPGSTPSGANITSLTPSTPTSTTPTPSQPNNDHIVQAALSSVLNSPSQMQKLLAALAAQSISPEVLPAVSQPHHQHLLAPTPYNPPQQYTPSISSAPGTTLPNGPVPARLPATYDHTPADAPSPFTLSLLGGSDSDQLVPLEQQDDRLQKTYRTAAEINNDVDELQNNIQSLIQSLGIDPTTLDTSISSVDGTSGVSSGGAPAPVPTSDADLFSPVNIGAAPDFDFDSFLMDMPRANEDDGEFDRLAERLDPSTVTKASDSTKIGNTSTERLHAFLDEVASQDGNENVGGGGTGTRHAQMPQFHASPGLTLPVGSASGVPASLAGTGAGAGAGAGAPASRGRKRKSDVIADGGHLYAPQEQPQVPGPAASSIAGNKSKRKR